jgi:Ring finger domain
MNIKFQLTDILLLLSERAPQLPSTELPPTTSSKHEGLSREEREKKIGDALKKNVGLTFMMIASIYSSLDQQVFARSKEPGEATNSTADLPNGQPDSEDATAHMERDQCVICLQSFEDGEMVVEPVREDCHHVFHKACIQAWLIRHDDCPYCRRDLFHFDDSCQV